MASSMSLYGVYTIAGASCPSKGTMPLNGAGNSKVNAAGAAKAV